MTTENPLLARIRMPGETFRLPSGGLFYPVGVLSEKVIDGEIHVHPMTAVDEIALKTPDLLYSGKAVEQVFGRCIPDVLQVGRLLAKDVDFLLICLRKVSFGSQLEISYKHDCKDAKERNYEVDVNIFLKKTKRIDPARIINDFHIDLTNGQVVDLHPITFEDYTTIMQANETDTDPEKLAKRLYFSVSKVIKSVDNYEESEFIQGWLAKIAPMLLKQITQAIDKTTEWGPDFMAPIKCRDCGQEVSVQAPLNPLAFFT